MVNNRSHGFYFILHKGNTIRIRFGMTFVDYIHSYGDEIQPRLSLADPLLNCNPLSDHGQKSSFNSHKQKKTESFSRLRYR